MVVLNHFRYLFLYLLVGLVLISCKSNENKSTQKIATNRPNILFAIIDDGSYPYFGAYGADWLETPNFDRIAAQGILFMNAFVPNNKCAPSRATILTGRNSWQLGNAANHQSYFPKRFQTFVEALGKHGYFTGYTGKPWAPGNPGEIDGRPRRLVGQPYNQKRTTPPTSAMSSNDYAANFKQFLNEKPEGKPFFFWYGSHEAHRPYTWRSGIEKGGMKSSQIDFIPGYLPDSDTTRIDLLDYGFEIEYFDKHLGRMLDLLKKRGQLHNTLVVVTADNGISFPGAKGQLYYGGSHMPLAIMWPAGIKNPGRKVTDFVSFIDLAPTFLDVASVNPKHTGMQSITGHSLFYIFKSDKSGRIDPNRDYVIVGKERHDVGRPHDRGYPIRGIITDRYQYLYNFKPDRWPAGNPETGYLNIDGSPTKTWILDHKKDSQYNKYWYHAMGKRRARELYNINADPAAMHNLLCRQGRKQEKYQNIADSLHKMLFNVLKWQGDARVFGRARQVFYSRPYASPHTRNFYKRYINGELTKKDAGWVNPSDFESKHPMKQVRRPCPAEKNN